MTYETYYQDIRRMFLSKADTLLYHSNPHIMQNNWLYGMEEMQKDEGERLIALLPIIKYEVEHKMLSAELEEELIIYHEDFAKGIFKQYINPKEYDIVEADLNWSFDNYPGTQYKE